MTDSAKKKFIAIYLIPAAVLADWAKTDPETRKTAEQKMHAEWAEWTKAHSSMILSTEVGGKTKRITTGGVGDFKNDIMLYSFIEAPSHEDAARAFENHPHLQIPQASIEVMEVKSMGPM